MRTLSRIHPKAYGDDGGRELLGPLRLFTNYHYLALGTPLHTHEATEGIGSKEAAAPSGFITGKTKRSHETVEDVLKLAQLARRSASTKLARMLTHAQVR